MPRTFQKDLEMQVGTQVSGVNMQVSKGPIQANLNRVSEREAMHHSVENPCPGGDPNVQDALSERTR